MQPLSTIEAGSLFIHESRTWIKLDFVGMFSICRQVKKDSSGKWEMFGCDEFIDSRLGVYDFIPAKFISALNMIS